jgi:Leucine-rich repeat (LRR) protein
MAVQTRQYFTVLFQPGYTLKAQDLKDMNDSTLFTNEDLGWDNTGKTYLPQKTISGILRYTSLSLIKMPSLVNENPNELDAEENQLEGFTIPVTWTNLEILDLATNLISDVDFTNAPATLIEVDLSVNNLTAIGVEHVLVPIAGKGSAAKINLTGVGNASHATWTANALAAETTITANGGQVYSNP